MYCTKISIRRQCDMEPTDQSLKPCTVSLRWAIIPNPAIPYLRNAHPVKPKISSRQFCGDTIDTQVPTFFKE